MILRMSFEELTALNSAVERILATPGSGAVLAPPEALAELESRLPLEGDVSVHTLGEQTRLLRALDLVVDHLKRRMDAIIEEQYVGSEDAVNAYFDYGNVRSLRSNLIGIGEEMEALLELMTGDPEGEDSKRIAFPD